jgi:hypothetical protein
MVGTLGKHSWTIKQRTGNNRREKKIIIVRLLWNTKEKVGRCNGIVAID